MMLWYFAAPLSGSHGVDLITLASDNRVIAVEVKATLQLGPARMSVCDDGQTPVGSACNTTEDLADGTPWVPTERT